LSAFVIGLNSSVPPQCHRASKKTYRPFPLAHRWTSQRNKRISLTSSSFLQTFLISQVSLYDSDIAVRGYLRRKLRRCAHVEGDEATFLNGGLGEYLTADAGSSNEEDVIPFRWHCRYAHLRLQLIRTKLIIKRTGHPYISLIMSATTQKTCLKNVHAIQIPTSKFGGPVN
jgi:hypothetical protein